MMVINNSVLATATIATNSSLDFDVRDDPSMSNDPTASFGFDLDSVLNEEQDDEIPIPNMDEKESTGRWTREEHLLFVKGLQLYGKGWKKIAGLIKTRTVVQIRTHAQKYFLKMSKARQSGETGTSRDGKAATQGNKKRKTAPRPSVDVAVTPCLQPFLQLPPPVAPSGVGAIGAIAPGDLGGDVHSPGGDDGVAVIEDASHIDIDRSLYNFLSAKITSHTQYNGSLMVHFDGDGRSTVKEYTIPRPDWFRKGLSLEFLLNEADHINAHLLQESGNNNGGITFGVATALQHGNISKSVRDSRFPDNLRVPAKISSILEAPGSISSAPATNKADIGAPRKRTASIENVVNSDDTICLTLSGVSSSILSCGVNSAKAIAAPSSTTEGATTMPCEGRSGLYSTEIRHMSSSSDSAGTPAAPASHTLSSTSASVSVAPQHSSSPAVNPLSATAAAPSLLLHQRQTQQAQRGISLQRPMVLQLQPGGGGPRGGQGGLGGAGSHSSHMTQQPASLSLQCLGLATSAQSSLSLMPAPPAAHRSCGSVSQQQQAIVPKEEVISSPVHNVSSSQSSDAMMTSVSSVPTAPSSGSGRSNVPSRGTAYHDAKYEEEKTAKAGEGGPLSIDD